MIKRSHVRQFLAVVDAGSFTQAAARMRVTQPTLSLGIAELERLVGAQLIVRDRRHLRLTEAGGRFLPLARELERKFAEADRFGEVRGTDWPELKLGLIKTLPGRAVQALVRALNPHCSLELVEGTDSELRAALSDGRLQAMIGLLRPDEAGEGVTVLLDEPYTMLVPAAHPLAGRGEVAPEELAAEVMIARRSCEILDQTSRFFTRHQVRPRFSLRSESDERCLQMVAAGLGITTAPASLQQEGTVPLRVTGYDFRRRLGLRAAPGYEASWAARLEHALAAFRAAIAD
ncbi:LysR family transcriptional regulator [Novosphingobium sp. NPDC080210]|uniref:LysR family transcriptional regulator n=1 Tax=Novosphingobium sp. NPDC080210 TaxID=3390596 RepID=UPI003D077798